MPVFSAAALSDHAAGVFAAAGAPPAEARTVAEMLVEANLVGHDSHGIIRIPQYIASIEDGNTVPGAPIEILNERPVTAVIDGHWGFGQVVGRRAVDLGREKAARFGVAALTIRQANHIGRLGAYVEALAAAGMIGLLVANMHGRGAGVVPWGGRQPRLGTNPLAIGFPTFDAAGQPGPPLVLDMTTSAVAEGKVRVARNRGQAVPLGWIVDAQGRPTEDPADLYAAQSGAILPFGGEAGYKGSGLGIVVDLLAGALSGAGCTGREEARFGNAAFLLVLSVEHFVPLADYRREVDGLVAFITSSPLTAGTDAIFMPGQIEQRQRQQRLQEGIFVEDETWQQIGAIAKRLGAEQPL